MIIIIILIVIILVIIKSILKEGRRRDQTRERKCFVSLPLLHYSSASSPCSVCWWRIKWVSEGWAAAYSPRDVFPHTLHSSTTVPTLLLSSPLSPALLSHYKAYLKLHLFWVLSNSVFMSMSVITFFYQSFWYHHEINGCGPQLCAPGFQFCLHFSHFHF